MTSPTGPAARDPDDVPDAPCWFCHREVPYDSLIAGYDTWDEQRLACHRCNEAIRWLNDHGLVVSRTPAPDPAPVREAALEALPKYRLNPEREGRPMLPDPLGSWVAWPDLRAALAARPGPYDDDEFLDDDRLVMPSPEFVQRDPMRRSAALRAAAPSDGAGGLDVAWATHEPHCNERCIHYLEGDGTVREAFGFPRVPRREPGGINPRQGVVTDPSPTEASDDRTDPTP